MPIPSITPSCVWIWTLIHTYQYPYFCYLFFMYSGIVMEFVDGQDLQAYLLRHGGSLDEDVARFVFQQLSITVRMGEVWAILTLTHVTQT